MVNIARGILLKEQFSYYFVLKCLSTNIATQLTKLSSNAFKRDMFLFLNKAWTEVRNIDFILKDLDIYVFHILRIRLKS